MANTAMQEYLDELNKMYNDVSFPSSVKRGLLISIQTAVNQLKSLDKERQQIVDAFDDGQANWDPKLQDYKDGKQYFEQTFKQ